MNKIEEIYDSKDTIKHIVTIKNKTYEVFGNKRHGPDDFNAVFHCEICDRDSVKFKLKVIAIKYKDTLICLDCLTNMIKAIELSMMEDNRKGI